MNATQKDHTTEQKLRELLDWRYREVVKESGIALDVALERGYYLEKTKRGLERLGFSRAQQQAPALVIPRFCPSGEPIEPQIKPESPRPDRKKSGKVIKYESVAGASVRLSVHPRCVPKMRDAQHPLWITEGDKTGDALVSRGCVVVVLQGVTCWNAMQDWEEIKLYEREVIIAFDADMAKNRKVWSELAKLAAFLHSRGVRG